MWDVISVVVDHIEAQLITLRTSYFHGTANSVIMPLVSSVTNILKLNIHFFKLFAKCLSVNQLRNSNYKQRDGFCPTHPTHRSLKALHRSRL